MGFCYVSGSLYIICQSFNHFVIFLVQPTSDIRNSLGPAKFSPYVLSSIYPTEIAFEIYRWELGKNYL